MILAMELISSSMICERRCWVGGHRRDIKVASDSLRKILQYLDWRRYHVSLMHRSCVKNAAAYFL